MLDKIFLIQLFLMPHWVGMKVRMPKDVKARPMKGKQTFPMKSRDLSTLKSS